MNYPRSFKIASALIALLFLALPTIGGSSQIRREKNEEWKFGESYGFPVWVASSFVIHAPALSHRHIYLLIDAKDFSENNIRTLFTSLAAEFAKPQELFIYAYSERAVLQKKLDKANSGILCSGVFADSPEGRRASRNSGIRDEPKRSGYYRAEYFRFSDGREQIEYTPHPEQEHVIKIDLKNTIPQYGGDPNKDVVSAAERGDFERLNDLIAQGADVNAMGNYGNTALSMAAGKGQTEVAKALLDKGAEVNSKDNNGYTALMSAAIDGGQEIVQMLLDHGAGVNAHTGIGRNSLDDTALMLAALHGHAGVVELLLAKGAKAEERNRFGETALMQAALAGFADVVMLLAMHGADVNARDVDGRTALMLAYDDRDTVETLLSLGANYNRIDKDGMTALMLAVSQYQSKKVEALIFGGAGKESLDAAQAYIAAPPDTKDRYAGYRKEEGYRILTEIYIKLGLKKKAVETGKQALEVLGDKAHLRARLGFTYLDVGDRGSALAQYKILIDGARRAKDQDTRRLYEDWAEGLMEELNK